MWVTNNYRVNRYCLYAGTKQKIRKQTQTYDLSGLQN